MDPYNNWRKSPIIKVRWKERPPSSIYRTRVFEPSTINASIILRKIGWNLIECIFYSSYISQMSIKKGEVWFWLKKVQFQFLLCHALPIMRCTFAKVSLRVTCIRLQSSASCIFFIIHLIWARIGHMNFDTWIMNFGHDFM